MDQGVIASVPLGLVIFAVLVLLGLGLGLGWTSALSYLNRKGSRTGRDNLLHIGAFLNGLPQAALTTDGEGRITSQNTLTLPLLKKLRWTDSLSSILARTIARVVHSGVAETMEIATPASPADRVQVTVAPLRSMGARAQALVLFAELNPGSGQAALNQRLISTIAHELRTPLTAIMGHVEILNSCRIDEETLWRRSLGFVAGETDRLARLVEDLLILSRLDRMSLHLQPVNLRLAAEEAISELFEIAEQNNVVPIFQAPTDVPRVLADLDRIRQVFLNLLDNAIKYAPGGELTVRLIPEADKVKVEVSDRGPGIAPEDLPHIFEPFRRGKQAVRGSRGTGLGLTIVRAILDQHQAPIRVQSEPERGTTFTFSLSVARSTESG